MFADSYKPSGEILEIEIKGFPICKFIEFYDGEYQNHALKLNKDEKICFTPTGLLKHRIRTGTFLET